MDLFDLYQHRQIRRAQSQLRAEASVNERRHRSASDEIDHLSARIDHLVLVNEALWQLVCEVTGLTDEHLDHRVLALDLADGAQDGRRKAPPIDCAGCGAKVNARAPRCQFCGIDAPSRSVFDSI